MSDGEEQSAPDAAPAPDGSADDRTRTGRAVSDRWQRRRRGIDAGALAAQSASFAAGIGRSVIGRRLAGSTVAVADASGLPARPPAAAWRMSEVEDDRRVDVPMPADLASLRSLMRAREAARRPVRVDLPARGLPMVAALGVSSSAGPRTGPLAAGVRYRPRAAMVDRPPEVAAASPLANPIAPGYAAQPAAAQAPASAPAPAEAEPGGPVDDGLDALRRLRAAREAQAAAERGEAAPTDRDRPPPAGGRAATDPAPTGSPSPSRSEPGPASATPPSPSASSSTGPSAASASASASGLAAGTSSPAARGAAGGIALATVLPLRRQRRLPVVRAHAPRPGRGPVAGTTGLPTGLPVGAPVAVAASSDAAGAPTGAAGAAWDHWPPPAAALAHHRVDRRVGAPSTSAAPAMGPATVTTATGRATSTAGAPLGAAAPTIAASATSARWASGDAPPTALRPFGMLTGPRPHQATAPVAPPDRFVSPALRVVAADAVDGAGTTGSAVPGMAGPPLDARPSATSRATARPTSGVGSLPLPTAAGGSLASPGASPTSAVASAPPRPVGGFPHWPPPASALDRPARAAATVLRRQLAAATEATTRPGPTAASIDGGSTSRSPGRGPSPTGPSASRPGRLGAAAAKWPHWPTPAGPPGPGDQPRRPHPVRPPARSWATPTDVDVELDVDAGGAAPAGSWPGERPEAPNRAARTHEEAAARFDAVIRRHRPDPLVDLPTPFRPLAKALVGDRRVRVSTGQASRAALAAAGHRAATVGTTIHLAEPLAPTAAHLDVVAHELTHVAAAPDRQGPRFLDDLKHDEEEGIAATIGRMARSLLPSALGNLLGGGTPAAPPIPGAPAIPGAPTIPGAPAIPGGRPLPPIPGASALPTAPPSPASALPGLAGFASTAAPGLAGAAAAMAPAAGAAGTAAAAAAAAGSTPSAPPAPALPSGTGIAGLPVGGASGLLQALSGALAPGATPAPRPAPSTAPGATPLSPPPAAPMPAGLAGAPTSLTPPAPSVEQAPAGQVAGSQADHTGGWGTAAGAGRSRSAAELGFPGSIPLPVRDTTISSPSVLEEAEVRRLVALIERRVLAELERRGGRGNGLGGSW